MTTYTGDKPFNPDTTWSITTTTPTLSFRDLAALAILQRHQQWYDNDPKAIFDLADKMDAERKRRDNA